MVVHEDTYAELTQHTDQDRVDTFTSFNSDATEKTKISTSEVSPNKIEARMPHYVARARENKVVPDCEEYNDGQCEDAVFDAALCDVAEKALEDAGLNNWAVGLDRLRALLLREARGFSSYGRLAEYVNKYSSDTLNEFGLGTAYGKSWYRKAAKEVEQTEEDDVLRDATFIAVHALFALGVPIPKAVKDRYDLTYAAGPDAADFSETPRDLALYALVERLLEIVVEKFDLGDSGHTSRELRRVIGIFAHDVITRRSIDRYDRAARHLFDLESALDGSTIRKTIDTMSVKKVESMFHDVYQALFTYAIESGAVSEPILIAYDRTDIENIDDSDADGSSNIDNRFYTEDGRLQFYSLATTDPDLDFAFRFRLVTSKAKRPEVLTNFLRDLTSVADVRLYLADAEFDGTRDLEVPRKAVPGNWLIHAQDIADDDPRSAHERLREKIEPGGADAVRNAGPADLQPPVKLVGYSKADDNAESPDPIEMFYTDMPLPTDQEDRKNRIEKVYFLYNQRNKIESTFGLIKSVFATASDTEKPVRKAFYVHISLLFYNIYNVVTTTPAPNNGLELETTPDELLFVMRNLAFDGPTPPDALQHLRDQS